MKASHQHHRRLRSALPGDEVTIRFARDDDGPQLERVAQRDTRRLPSGRLLVAEVADEILAARSLATEEAVADPFRPTADLVRMLAVRAAQLRPARPRPRLAHRLRPHYAGAEAS